MRALTSILVMSFTGFPAAARQMYVSLCNLGELSDSTVTRAKAETESVFLSAGVQIEWKSCDEGPDGSVRTVWFTLRLRSGRPPQTAGPASLDAMGRAFLSPNGSGYLADAYIESIRVLADRYQGDPDALLGYVIAHELGHLLLGPGHVPDGIMRAAWNEGELKALRQRWFKFNQAERIRIQRELNLRDRNSR